MAYSAGNNLPFEPASKIGHLAVIHSEWVNELIRNFESTEEESFGDEEKGLWQTYDPCKETPLEEIWVSDGSYQEVVENKREVSFIKTALMNIQQRKIDKIDKNNPHPLLLQDIMKDSAEYHSTILPLRNVVSKGKSINESVRYIIYDSMRMDPSNGRMYFDTLKWLTYKKWSNEKAHSLDFECPYCAQKIEDGIPYDSDEGICPHCNKKVLLTDMLGFHLDMSEESVSGKVATSYMLIMELLMLFTIIRLQWDMQDKQAVTRTLFIKDGPMTLGAQYSKLVPNIREFLDYAQKQGRPIHIMGSEKSGKFMDYLDSIKRYIPYEPGKIKYAVLSHEFIQRVIQRTPEQPNPYGIRTNWGEKVLVSIDPNTNYVLNITTGGYDKDDKNYPHEKDLIGLNKILSTIPSIISRKYEGALYPVELANGIASMSNYPSAKILERFVADNLK